MKKRTLIIIIILILAVGVVFFEWPWVFQMEYETQNVKDYKKCLRLVSSLPGVTEVFPKKLPASAKDDSGSNTNGNTGGASKDVSFWCYNNMGGKKLELRFKATDDEIEEYSQNAEKNAVCYGDIDTEAVQKSLPEYKLAQIGKRQTVYILDSSPYKENDFNHAKLVWVTIDEETKYISFNAEEY